ncbi:MAG: XRE family transcriptional regulator, partial [Halomonas sp.]
LLPRNRVKLKVAANFNWIENGPIQQFFQQRIASEYFNSRFQAEDENLIVLNGMLSKSSNQAFQRRMQRLAREFEEFNREDVALDFDTRHGATVIIAIRGWHYGLFKNGGGERTAHL